MKRRTLSKGSATKPAIAAGRNRLAVYYFRVILALDGGNRNQALADLSELSLIARRLWEDLAKEKEDGDPA
jgi:hypothetical protein